MRNKFLLYIKEKDKTKFSKTMKHRQSQCFQLKMKINITLEREKLYLLKQILSAFYVQERVWGGFPRSALPGKDFIIYRGART